MLREDLTEMSGEDGSGYNARSARRTPASSTSAFIRIFGVPPVGDADR